jgi:hypothetical protein
LIGEIAPLVAKTTPLALVIIEQSARQGQSSNEPDLCLS